MNNKKLTLALDYCLDWLPKDNEQRVKKLSEFKNDFDVDDYI